MMINLILAIYGTSNSSNRQLFVENSPKQIKIDEMLAL